MLRRLGLSLGACLAFARPVVALDDPDQLIRSLYALAGGVDTPALADRYLSADLSAPYKAQLASDEVQPATGFDWRFDAQDVEVTNIRFETRGPITVRGATAADVEVLFENFGEQKEITYSLCLGPRGWRIYDARNLDGEGDWSLRETLLGVEGEVNC